MKKDIPAFEFWMTFIGGLCLTLVYFFDFKTDIITRVDRVEAKLDMIIQKDKDDNVTTVFNTEVPKRAGISRAK